MPNNALCADNNPCTFNDRCLAGLGCTFTSHPGTPCSTGDICNPGICGESQCGPLPGGRCGDSNTCTQDFCDSATGACSYTQLTGPCNDFNSCTQNDTCQSGICVGEPTPGGQPILTFQQLDPNVIYHANHKMVSVRAIVSAHDTCGNTIPPILVSITSSQPDDAPGPTDGHTINDVQEADFGTSDLNFLLRAEVDRASDANRIYTVTYSATSDDQTVTRSSSIAVFRRFQDAIHPTSSPKRKPLPKD